MLPSCFVAILGLGAMLASAPAFAQVPATLDCVAATNATANDKLTAYTAASDTNFRLTFSQMDDGRFAMIGNLGLSPLVTTVSKSSIHLIESPPLGGMNATTIELPGNKGEFNAVHSRHAMILGSLVPSQYLLKCRSR